MRIIPAIDIIDGKCVRLSKGDYTTKKIYSEHPLEIAKSFEGHGMKYLHVVDLDGAKSRHIVNYKILEAIATNTGLKVDFGGGLKSDKDVEIAFECGAHQITGGSIAAKEPTVFLQWLKQYGPDKIILGADAHHRKIATDGWQQGSELEVVDFIRDYAEKGVTYTISTDIAKDGMLQGPSLELYKEILDKTKVKLIASGGITTLQDLEHLQAIGCEGAIIGKAIYEGHLTLKQLETLC